MHLSRLSLVALATLTLVAVAAPANAQFSLVTVRANILATDNINWSQYGPAFTTVANPSLGLSTNSVLFGISLSGNSLMERRDQNNGWAGNFAPAAPALWTRGSNGPLTVDFLGNILFAAGAQIQRNQGGAFTGSVQAFDAVGNLLFSSSLPGVSDGAADDSAIFIGIQSVSQPFARIRFNTDTSDFAINQLDFRTVRGGAAAPEPGTLALLSVVGLGTLALRRRK